jgi:hypothetical protein
MQGREYGSLYGNENEGDPLMDTASYQPAVSAHSERGESGGIKMTLPLIGQKCYYLEQRVAKDQKTGHR